MSLTSLTTESNLLPDTVTSDWRLFTVTDCQNIKHKFTINRTAEYTKTHKHKHTNCTTTLYTATHRHDIKHKHTNCTTTLYTATHCHMNDELIKLMNTRSTLLVKYKLAALISCAKFKTSFS